MQTKQRPIYSYQNTAILLLSHLVSICHQDSSPDWLTFLTKTVNTRIDLNAKDLPVIKFLTFNKVTNFSEDALKTIYDLYFGSETEIMKFCELGRKTRDQNVFIVSTLLEPEHFLRIS